MKNITKIYYIINEIDIKVINQDKKSSKANNKK